MPAVVGYDDLSIFNLSLFAFWWKLNPFPDSLTLEIFPKLSHIRARPVFPNVHTLFPQSETEMQRKETHVGTYPKMFIFPTEYPRNCLINKK